MDNLPISFQTLSQKEWIYTNGLGSYASTTALGTNTRRYHGLLVASFNPPTERKVIVSRIEEHLYFGNDSVIALSTNQFSEDFIDPKGYEYFTEFNRKPLPETIFTLNGKKVKKTVFMVNQSNTTVVEYANIGLKPFKLRLRPFLAYRDYHSLAREDAFFDFYTEKNKGYWKTYAHYGAHPLFYTTTKGDWTQEKLWYKNHFYQGEQARGLDTQEDTCTTGYYEVWLEPGENVYLTFSLDESMMLKEPVRLKLAEIERLSKLKKGYQYNDDFLIDLILAGNQFIVKRQSTQSDTIIAGYHWFTDWGRDTMIAMRGLCIAVGNRKTSQSILSTFFKYLNQGMLPNRFPDNGEEVEYNTIDATLWLFVTLYEYYQKFKDLDFVEDVFSQLTEVLEAHIRGTRYNIHVTPEGFLYGGEGIAQLTWMDARVGDYVVTPRHGCPVEINILWYNALKIYQYFAGKLSKDNAYEEYIGKIEHNFRAFFWNEAGYLNDVVLPTQAPDASIRPNQIYALSLPFTLLSDTEEKQVFDTVTKYLYTDYGLRTLNQEHPDFKPTYGGDQWQRDTAYHQGTVWPFLLGEYWSAYLKVHQYSLEAKETVKRMMIPLKNHFYHDNCLHGISEIFDGEKPAMGKGTIHQAWSIGALIQVIVQYGLINNIENQDNDFSIEKTLAYLSH
jgi:predicted glycogen debranching enzyme